jgi:beta-lactamase class A
MRQSFFLACAVFFSWCAWSAGSEPSALDAKLTALAKAHKGKVAIAVKHLGTGESFFLNADEPMPTASLIKLPVMMEVYLQAEEGKLRLSDPVTLHNADKVPGSGILTDHFSDGATFSLRDAVRLMIVYSDNTATNMVLDKIGIPSTNHRMEAWGLKETKINAKSFRGSTTSVNPQRTRRYGLGSTTAREMVTLLEDLEACRHIRPALKQVMLTHLKRCDDKDKFPRFLPAGTVIAHKTGSVSDARTDAGLLYLGDAAIALCVLSNNNQDQRWQPDNAGNVLCARVAKEVYDYFAHKDETKKTAERR